MTSHKQNRITRVGIVVLVVTSILILFVAMTAREKQSNDAIAYGKQIVSKISSDLKGENNLLIQITKDVVNAQSTGGFGKRDETARFLHRLLQSNPDIIGAYVAYEPNADGQDQSWVGRPECDSSGRFLPYWNRVDGSDMIEALVDMESSDWYQVPKNKLEPSIIEPAYYNGVLMTSYVAPIIVNEKIEGVGGVDREINAIQNELQTYKPFQSAQFVLLSENGLLIAAPDETILGKNISHYPRIEAIFQDRIQSEEVAFKAVKNPFSGTDSWLFYAPIDNAGWTIAMLVDQDEALASVNKMFRTTLFLALVTLILIGILFYTIGILRLSEERFSKAFNASPITMVITSIESGKIIDANDSFLKSFGSAREEIIGKTTIEIGLWGHAVARNLSIQMITEKGSYRDLENTFYTKSGERRLGLCSAVRMDIDGLPCMLTIVKDITEQRKMEIEMLRMDRLNLVGQMAASLGHEIRNPMTAVRGFLQMFKHKYIEDKEILDLMIEELDEANEIITEFLSLAKNKTVELQPANLNTIMIKILPLLQANAKLEEKIVQIEIGEIPDVMVDEKEIRQLILNLIKNGLESMPLEGTVIIKTFTDDNGVVLSVQDQGCGVEPNLMDKLGIPFFTTKEQGTGLGLAVCYGIAARHQAKIDFETGSGGTTFYVRFPRMEDRSNKFNDEKKEMG